MRMGKAGSQPWCARGLRAVRRRPAPLLRLLAGTCAVGAALAVPMTPAAAPPDAIAQVKATVDKVVQILKDPALKSNVQERRRQLKDVVIGHFDFAEMARSALGYHWRDLGDQQRKDFVDLFTRFIEAAYISRIEGYSGQQIDYVKELSDAPDYAQVNTNILQEGKDPISLNYRLKLESDDWKVYDVTVDNISIVANYRNQFNRVINNKGFEALMGDMRAKQEGLDQAIAK